MSTFFSKTAVLHLNTSATITHEKENIQDQKTFDRKSEISEVTNRYADLFKFVERKHNPKSHSHSPIHVKQRNRSTKTTPKKLTSNKQIEK